MKKLFIIIIAISISVGFACKKKKKDASGEKLFTYNSLVTDKDSIKQGNVTNVRANISGEGTYVWTCSSGDIFGSGSVILFGAGSCCMGNHNVTCTITDKNNNKEERTVSVIVY